MNHKDISIIGEIVIPEFDNKKFEGVHLTLKNGEKPYLEFNNPDKDLPQKISIIIGTFTAVGRVTFIDCRNFGQHIGASGKMVKFKATSYIKGFHFSAINELEFNKFSIEIPNVKSWLKSKNIVYDKDKYLLKGPEKVEYSFKSNISFSYYSTYHVSSYLKSIELRETIFFTFENSNGSFSINEILNYIKKLQFLFFLLQSEKPEIDSILVYKNNIIDVYEEKTQLRDLQLFNAQQTIRDSNALSSLNIDFKDIKDSFGKILINWYQKELESSIELLMNKNFQPKLTIENHFLNLCFGIESFHKKFYNYKLFQDDEFEKRKNYIKDNIKNKEYQKWIFDNLTFANQPSFGQRLSSFNSSFELLDVNSEEIIRKIVRTRNYLVHKVKDNKHVCKGVDLLVISIYLEAIFKMKIFDLLGIEVDIYKKKLEVIKRDIEYIKYIN